MKIKDVSLQDLNQIYKLEKLIFGEDAFSKDLIRKLIRRNIFFLKLEKKGLIKQLIGFAIAVKDRKDRINIINFLINPKFQNQGYGSYLLNEIIKRVKELDEIIQIVLNVKVNNEAAIHLYEKFRFKIVKRIDNYYRSGDAGFLMELDL